MDSFTSLVDPSHPDVIKMAARFSKPEETYYFVRNKIVFNPTRPAAHPAATLEAKSASCLGKCILLCSLYRAMGIPAADVRIVTGELDIPGAQVEHAWIDMEYQGTCLQQDASSLLGHFAFDQFVGDTYTSQFVRKEGYAFNDTGFAIVSQLNRFKGRSHPGKPQTGR